MPPWAQVNLEPVWSRTTDEDMEIQLETRLEELFSNPKMATGILTAHSECEKLRAPWHPGKHATRVQKRTPRVGGNLARPEGFLPASTNPFGKIYCRPYKEALSFARQAAEHEEGDNSTIMIIWPDASLDNAQSGVAVAFRDPADHSRWTEKTHHVLGISDPTEGELLAIGLAMKVCWEEVNKHKHTSPVSTLRIFSDCLRALKSLEFPEALEHMACLHVRRIFELATLLRQRSVGLELHWVPRCSVRGARLADRLSKSARKYPRLFKTKEASEVLDLDMDVLSSEGGTFVSNVDAVKSCESHGSGRSMAHVNATPSTAD